MISPVGFDKLVSLIFFPLYHKSIKEVSTFCACELTAKKIKKIPKSVRIKEECRHDLIGMMMARELRKFLYLIKFF
jgi:hypothetical protein